MHDEREIGSSYSRAPFHSDLTSPVHRGAVVSLSSASPAKVSEGYTVAFLTSASDTVLSAKLRTLQWRKAVPPSCTVTLDTVLLSFASFTLCSSSRLLNQRARQSDGVLYGTRRSAERKMTSGCNYVDLIKSIVSGKQGEESSRRATPQLPAKLSSSARQTFLSKQRKIEVIKVTGNGERREENTVAKLPNSACSTS